MDQFTKTSHNNSSLTWTKKLRTIMEDFLGKYIRKQNESTSM